MKRNKDNDEVSRIAGRVDRKTTTTAICYDVPQFTSTVNQQYLANAHTMTKIPTELSSFKKIAAFQKIVEQRTEWIFEISGGRRIDVTSYVWVSFQQRDWVDDKLRNINRFYRSAVTSAQCKFWTEKIPETRINLVFTKGELFEGNAKMCLVSSIWKKKIHFNYKKHRKTPN